MKAAAKIDAQAQQAADGLLDQFFRNAGWHVRAGAVEIRSQLDAIFWPVQQYTVRRLMRPRAAARTRRRKLR